jgi:hypothetical protein
MMDEREIIMSATLTPAAARPVLDVKNREPSGFR